MHLGLICDEYPPGPHGGVGTFTCDLAEGLVQSGHRVTVIVAEMGQARHWVNAPSEKLGGNPCIVPIHLPSPKWMRWRPGALWQRWTLRQALLRLHRRTPLDVLECMDNWGLLPFGGPRRVPTVVRLHGSTFLFDQELGLNTADAFTHQLEKWTMRAADHLVGVSDWISRRQPALAGLSQRAVRTIYNAIDTEFFKPDLSVLRERGLIVFANSIHPRKGVLQLCQAMNIVLRTHPYARLLLIGKHISLIPSSGRPLAEECLDHIQPEFRDRIVFTGRLELRSEVLRHMQRAHVCCYPSTLEGLGIAPLEAMALGKPTIFSSTGPGAEVIEHEESGLLCNPYDPVDIAAQITRVFDDADLAERIGKGGRERVFLKFDRRKWIAVNEGFYQNCLRK